MPEPRKRWRVVIGVIASILLFLTASTIAIVWLGPEFSDSQVIEEWNSTISKLGIDPVFPPEEDVAVGDIYAVLDDRGGQPSSRTALALRSIKLDHKNLTADIERVHKDSYLFPNTPPRPDDQNKPWDQLPNAEGILSHPTKRTTLPIAAFPGFTIWQKRSIGGGLLGWLSTTVGFQSDRGVELNIPVAETYGIPSIIASGELEQFCSDKDYPNRCTDQTLRRHLSFVTQRAFERKSDKNDDAAIANPVAAEASTDTKLQAPPADSYKYPLEVVLVNRVYLARYIDQRVTDSRSAGSSIKTPKPGSKPLEGASTQGKEQPPDEDRKDSGAALTFSKDDGQSIKQTFLRPVVIGYRAVKRLPKEDIVTTTNAASSVKLNECITDAGKDNPSKDCRAALGSAPAPTVNAIQPTGIDVRQTTDDTKRYRIYLHTAGQSGDILTNTRAALKGAGYAIQGEDAQADTDAKERTNGAGVDYFSDADSIGAASVSKIVGAAVGASVPRRRQNVYNPIGVLGVWLPIPTQPASPQIAQPGAESCFSIFGAARYRRRAGGIVPRSSPSLRAKRSNPSSRNKASMDCFVAMT